MPGPVLRRRAFSSGNAIGLGFRREAEFLVQEGAECSLGSRIDDVDSANARQFPDEFDGSRGLRGGARHQVGLQTECLLNTDDRIGVRRAQDRGNDAVANFVDQRLAVVWLQR